MQDDWQQANKEAQLVLLKHYHHILGKQIQHTNQLINTHALSHPEEESNAAAASQRAKQIIRTKQVRSKFLNTDNNDVYLPRTFLSLIDPTNRDQFTRLEQLTDLFDKPIRQIDTSHFFNQIKQLFPVFNDKDLPIATSTPTSPNQASGNSTTSSATLSSTHSNSSLYRGGHPLPHEQTNISTNGSNHATLPIRQTRQPTGPRQPTDTSCQQPTASKRPLIRSPSSSELITLNEESDSQPDENLAAAITTSNTTPSQATSKQSKKH